MKSIASTIARRGIWAGAPRRPGGSNRSATSSHCSSVKAIAKLMAAIVAARDVSFDGTHPRSERELSATGPESSSDVLWGYARLEQDLQRGSRSGEISIEISPEIIITGGLERRGVAAERQ